MSTGIVSDITMAVYCSTDVITFTRIVSENQQYLGLTYTVMEEETAPYYFKWSDIPNEIYSLYLHSKMFSDIVYNDYIDEYVLTGTHLLRKKESECVLAYFYPDNFPINNEEVIIDNVCTSIDDLSNDDIEFFTNLLQDMLKVKNYSTSFIRGPSVVRGG